MAIVDPVPGVPVAVAELDTERALVVADYHAGYEIALRREGVELESRSQERRERLLALLDRLAPDRVVFLGDLIHSIGRPTAREREEVTTLLDAVTARMPATLVKGNHDGEIEDMVSIPVTPSEGVRIGEVGLAHGHTWPAREVLTADVVCIGHEHPTVRLEDAVGGSRIERAWLRGRLDGQPFADRYDDLRIDGELIVFPAYNELAGGTWVNVEGQTFLTPFLPDGLPDGEAYLLDGTRLGDYRRF